MIIDCGDRKSAGFVETRWCYGVQQEICHGFFIQHFFSLVLKLQCVFTARPDFAELDVFLGQHFNPKM